MLASVVLCSNFANFLGVGSVMFQLEVYAFRIIIMLTCNVCISSCSYGKFSVVVWVCDYSFSLCLMSVQEIIEKVL